MGEERDEQHTLRLSIDGARSAPSTAIDSVETTSRSHTPPIPCSSPGFVSLTVTAVRNAYVSPNQDTMPSDPEGEPTPSTS